MAYLGEQLDLDRCPHCGVAKPTLTLGQNFTTKDHWGVNSWSWGVYICTTCGGVVTARASKFHAEVDASFPPSRRVSEDVPAKPRAYLNQALLSAESPAGSIMLAASAIDAMLKQKGLVDGMLYARIDKAAKAHIITEDMARWAHHVRLEANDQRHADDDAELPTQKEAQLSVEFAMALAEILFVLPARVTRGLVSATTRVTAK